MFMKQWHPALSGPLSRPELTWCRPVRRRGRGSWRAGAASRVCHPPVPPSPRQPALCSWPPGGSKRGRGETAAEKDDAKWHKLASDSLPIDRCDVLPPPHAAHLCRQAIATCYEHPRLAEPAGKGIGWAGGGKGGGIATPAGACAPAAIGPVAIRTSTSSIHLPLLRLHAPNAQLPVVNSSLVLRELLAGLG